MALAIGGHSGFASVTDEHIGVAHDIHQVLAPGQPYAFEILAIEESGNQTIAAQSFSTE